MIPQLLHDGTKQVPKSSADTIKRIGNNQQTTKKELLDKNIVSARYKKAHEHGPETKHSKPQDTITHCRNQTEQPQQKEL